MGYKQGTNFELVRKLNQRLPAYKNHSGIREIGVGAIQLSYNVPTMMKCMCDVSKCEL